jgi:hypothetical protein
MKNLILILAFVSLAAGCAAVDRGVYYRPNAQIMPQNITRIHVRPFINRTEVPGLEDRLSAEVADEFLRNARYGIANESNSGGILAGEITRYILIPIQYDTQLVPTAYRMEVLFKVRFIDKALEETAWEEPALLQSYIFSVSALPGGMSEEQAREELWKNFAKVIVRRTVDGFGSVRSETRQRLQSGASYTTIAK